MWSIFMDRIKIYVNRQLDGYTFSLTPSMRNIVKRMFPDANPANNIFVAYETQSDVKSFGVRLKNLILPGLLGTENIKTNIKISFVDTKTGKEFSGNSLHE
jgi:hypothetical protein